MPSIGPSLPPHLSKRNRTPDGEDDDQQTPYRPTTKESRNTDEIDLSDSDHEEELNGKTSPRSNPSAARSNPSIGPSLPPPPPSTINKAEIQLEGSESGSEDDCRPRAPESPTKAPPSKPTPASNPEPDLDDSDSDSEDDDSDDNYGPSLPNAAAASTVGVPCYKIRSSAAFAFTQGSIPEAQRASRRAPDSC